LAHPVSWRFFEEVDKVVSDIRGRKDYYAGYDEVVVYLRRLHAVFDE